MEQIASPDKPAYFCYLVVVLVGLWVAQRKVNALMASSQGRWGFLETWLVFGAYALVPVLLFWLLDFSNALHDTSLFAALLVALGYRQILAGEMKGTTAPAQFSALWSPFETWANQVRDRIATKNKVTSDRFNNTLQSILAQDAARVAGLVELAYRTAEDPTQLATDLAALKSAPRPADIAQDAFDRIQVRGRVARCLQSIRTVNPEDYGNDLYSEKLLSFNQYWLLLGNAAAQLWLLYGLVFIFFLLAAFGSLFFQPHNLLRYHQWRFQKINATERDHFRTREFLAGRINAAAGDKKAAFEIIEPLVRLLRYRDIDRKVAENILSLILEFRRPELTQQAVPLLIESLRTENPDVRLRIHQTLQALRTLAYENSMQAEDLTSWVPSKSESAADVEKQINKYRAWWDAVSAGAAPNATTPSRK